MYTHSHTLETPVYTHILSDAMQVGGLHPEQLVLVMEVYAKASTLWDRTLFYTAAADIARRPQDFSVGGGPCHLLGQNRKKKKTTQAGKVLPTRRV